ncbi:MAG: CBS domain-containing protein [Eggerthellaceae bacterium]|nr:CBS domain-containing protein [Eggerthellaceae bacterium]
MLYLSQMLGKPVVDSTGEKIGTISDLAISTGEVFPRITSLAFQGPGKVPFMISWRKYVNEFSEDGITLAMPAVDIRFSYLQPDEVLLARDLLNRQIVDTQGLKVVRVNDLKLSQSGTQLRLLGAEVGVRGILRSLSPWVERAAVGIAKAFGRTLDEHIIAWNYMDLLDRDLSDVQLSVTHKRLDELHPADVADILEQLDPQQRANVFKHLDDTQAGEAVAEMEDELQADFIEDLDEKRAAGVLGNMDPDDAADIVRDLPYEKAETLLRLMGVEDAIEIRALLGYRDGTAGGMMTRQFVTVHTDSTVREAIETLRALPEDAPSVHYIYILDDDERLVGVASIRTLVLNEDDAVMGDIMYDEIISVPPEESEEEVVEDIFKYELTAMPVVDERGVLLGIITVDDAWDALEDDHVIEKNRFTPAKIAGVVLGVTVVLSLYTYILVRLLG